LLRKARDFFASDRSLREKAFPVWLAAVLVLIVVVAIQSTLSSSPEATAPPPASPTESGQVPSKTATVYLATALACQFLDREEVTFEPLLVEGADFSATVQPSTGCQELSMWNSYVYEVPIPTNGKVTVTPGDQPGAELDAARLADSGAATVYYGRKGEGSYAVTTTEYKQTADVRDAG
jgi:hypothetical protein